MQSYMSPYFVYNNQSAISPIINLGIIRVLELIPVNYSPSHAQSEFERGLVTYYKFSDVLALEFTSLT